MRILRAQDATARRDYEEQSLPIEALSGIVTIGSETLHLPHLFSIEIILRLRDVTVR